MRHCQPMSGSKMPRSGRARRPRCCATSCCAMPIGPVWLTGSISHCARIDVRIHHQESQETCMQISMYQASVPRFIHMLGNLSAILVKAKDHAAAKGIKEEAFTSFRLYPDMLPFARQIMLATDTAKACPARLAGV